MTGDFKIPCPGEPFLEPLGDIFDEAEFNAREADTRNDASKAFDIDIASNEVDPEFSNVQRNVAEVQTNRNNPKLKPPHLVALNSTDETLTWQLEGLDPKIKIDKYQVEVERYSGCLILLDF